MAQQVNSKKVAPLHYKEYLNRSEELLNASQYSFENQNWDACALNAVHAAISASDALTTYKLGERSAGQSHDEAVRLFKQTDFQDKETQSNAVRLSSILKEKNASAYEEKPVKPRTAEILLIESRRLLEFVKIKVPV